MEQAFIEQAFIELALKEVAFSELGKELDPVARQLYSVTLIVRK